MTRQPDIATRARVHWIIEQIAKGSFRRRDLLQNFTDLFEVKESQFDKDLRRAKEHMREPLKEERDGLISEALAKFNFLYEKNLKIQDYREARQVIEATSKLLGLNAAEKRDITTGGQSINRTTEELLKIARLADNKED